MSDSSGDTRKLPPSFPFARYEVKGLLGEGSRKRVFRAHDTRLDRAVAVAFIKTEGLDEIALDRVHREAGEDLFGTPMIQGMSLLPDTMIQGMSLLPDTMILNGEYSEVRLEP